MTKKTFLIEMDDVEFCIHLVTTMARSYCVSNRKCCKGDINNRPDWCPLREVELQEMDILKDIASMDTESVWTEKE